MMPTTRYDARRPLGPDLETMLDTPRLSTAFSGEYWNEVKHDPRNFQPYAGERFAGGTRPPLESRLSLLFRTPYKLWHPRSGKVDACVLSEHGLPRLNALLVVAGTRVLEQIEREEFADHGSQDQVADRMAWHLLDMYTAICQDLATAGRIDAKWSPDVPRFTQGLAELFPERHIRARIEGDISIMYQFIKDVRTLGNPLLPLTRSHEALIDELAERGYPRVAETRDATDARQRYWVIYRAIAADLEWVRIATADWRDLKRAAGLEARGKKPAT